MATATSLTEAFIQDSLMRGDNLAVASVKSATRHIFHFDCGGHRLVVDIQLKAD